MHGMQVYSGFGRVRRMLISKTCGCESNAARLLARKKKMVLRSTPSSFLFVACNFAEAAKRPWAEKLWGSEMRSFSKGNTRVGRLQQFHASIARRPNLMLQCHDL
jgi:hypothetical protein